ncbi:MAG: sulfatase-like hydrolase/transferase [Bacteroidota bacterium]
MKVNRFYFYKSLFLVLIGLSSCTSKAQNNPNVVLIVLDDLNDYVGVMGGHPQAITPNIDRLAGEGVLFSNAHSNAPVCAPSRSSFLTGILPSTSGNYGFAKWYENDVLKNSKTIMEYMSDNGYFTGKAGKLMHHAVNSLWDEVGVGSDQGPFAYNGQDRVAHPSVPEAFGAIGLLDGTFASLSDVPTVNGYTGWVDKNSNPFKYNSPEDRDLLNDEKTAEWFENKINELEASSSDQPFFLATGILNPHTVHVVPQKYFDMYPIESMVLPEILLNDIQDTYYNDNLPSTKGITHYDALEASYEDIEYGIKKYMQAYLACVTFADDQVGRILDALDQSRFKDNTIVILFSDHGYHMGQKEYLFKNSLWEESTRVPLIIRTPDLQHKGAEVDTPVSLVDVYPTIQELCNLEGSTRKNCEGAELDGTSLVPFLDDPLGVWEGPKSALSVVNNPVTNDHGLQNYSLRSKQYRYIKYGDASEELYDHDVDAYEWNNVKDNPDYQSVLEEMRQELSSYIISANIYNHEAENGVLSGTVEVGSGCDYASGGSFVKLQNNSGNSILFNDIEVEESGNYLLNIDYFMVGESEVELFVNEQPVDTVSFLSANWCYQGAPSRMSLDVNLNAGLNSINLVVGNETGPFIDKISIDILKPKADLVLSQTILEAGDNVEIIAQLSKESSIRQFVCYQVSGISDTYFTVSDDEIIIEPNSIQGVISLTANADNTNTEDEVGTITLTATSSGIELGTSLSSDITILKFDPLASVDEVNASLLSYPNPVRNRFTIDTEFSNINKLKITNTGGQLVSFSHTGNGIYDVSNLSRGVYLVHIYTNDNKQHIIKIVKK